MLDQSTRVAILKLQQQGHSIRGIVEQVHVSVSVATFQRASRLFVTIC
jgi:hypothetical protein